MNDIVEPYELDIAWLEAQVAASDDSIELFAERVSEFISSGMSELDERNAALKMVCQ